MISKFAKAQKSFVAKLILTLTALSFMSLFGITGYLTSASNNRTVIKVDNIEVSQAEFQYELQKELSAAKNILNTELDDDAMADLRSSMTNVVATKILKDSILDRTAQKYHVLFRPELISRMIAHEPSFQDLAGNFNRDLFRRVLSENHISESEYVQSLTRSLAEQVLVVWPVRGAFVPQVLLDAETKIDNKRRTFKYMEINPDSMTIGREISEDEIEQYYEDFASQFIAPEKRDLSVVYLSLDHIAKTMEITDEDIKAYYDEHIESYETPEKRHVLQMMFNDEETANTAYDDLQKGVDFYEVAEQKAGQSKEETDLGLASENELVFEIAEDTFALKKDGYTKPVQVGDIWQIIKVVDINAPTKVDYKKASEEIKNELVSDGLYEATYKVLSQVEDELGAGKALEEIAPMFGLKVDTVKGLADDGTAREISSKDIENVIKSSDFIDTAFSYATGETSQTIETDEGLVILRVDAIEESHQKPIEEVSDEIKTLWADGERTALAQEMVNDVMHDLEEGDDFAKTAARYGLHVYKSQPITRNESVADLSYQDIRELFMQDLNVPYQANVDAHYVVVVPTESFENTVPLSEEEMNLVRFKTYHGLVGDLQKAMIDSYAKDYKTKVKYNLMGIED